MKKEFFICPEVFKDRNFYGFDWLEGLTAIPFPLALVTSYKSNGKTNASMQSWFTFSSDNGFYCFFSSVHKGTHMYQTIHETNQLVINFMSADWFKRCYSTIENNRIDDDEIAAAGLTARKGSKVNAPLVEECFLNLECEYMWEKEIFPGSIHVVMCVKIVNAWLDEEYYKSNGHGRYGDTGYLYNIHSPLDPENGTADQTCLGIIRKKYYDEI